MEITTTSQLEDYLTSSSIPFASVQTLSTGAANYAWRIKDLSGNKSIVKHAAPYLRIDRSIPLPIEQLDFEAQAISTMSSIQPIEAHVQVPKLLTHDPKAHLIQISDAGSRNLVEAFPFMDLEISILGSRIGKWLAQLHSTPKELNIGNNQLGAHASQHSTRNLILALRQLGYDATVGERIFSLLFGQKEEDLCQCHGDFLPSNIIVSDDPTPTPQLTVIDWEWTRRGNGAFDVALFAGEAWLMEYFLKKEDSSERGLLDSFLTSYLKTRDLTIEDKLKVAARFGVQITYWPTTGRWGQERTDECVGYGFALLQKILERDLSWLRQSMLKVLFEAKAVPHGS